MADQSQIPWGWLILALFVCGVCLLLSLGGGFAAWWFWPEAEETAEPAPAPTTPITTPTTNGTPTTTTTTTTTTEPEPAPPITQETTTAPATQETTPAPVAAAPETCGFPEGEKAVIQISGNQTLSNIIGYTAARYFDLPELPTGGIKLKNWQFAIHTVDVWIAGEDNGCRTIELTPENKIIVKKAYNDDDFIYSYENGEIFIETSTGKHQVTNL